MKTRMHAKFSSYQTKLQNVYHHQKQIHRYLYFRYVGIQKLDQILPSFDPHPLEWTIIDYVPFFGHVVIECPHINFSFTRTFFPQLLVYFSERFLFEVKNRKASCMLWAGICTF